MADASPEEGTADHVAADARGSRSSGSRPSFTDYWKRTKEAARNITFVTSTLEHSIGSKKGNDQSQEQPSDLTAQAKALARRQQVRKAQKQHRQRKVNYTKQLEMDVAKLRDLIEQTERETIALRDENELIRRRIIEKVAPPSALASVSLGYTPPQPPEYTVSLLGSSDSLDAPVYQVRRIPTSSSWSSRSAASSGRVSSSAGGFLDADPRNPRVLSDAETEQAINFILALEHVCWDHFHPTHYSHTDYDPEANETGHSLMVSSMALRSAPTEAWNRIAAEKDRQASLAEASPSPSLPLFQFSPNHPHPHPHPHNSNHASINSNASASNPNPNKVVVASWPTPPTTGSSGSDLSLASLYGLASALNPDPGEAGELAPVQAWFEMARLYGGGAAVLRDAARLERVRRALAPAVRCVHYGAAIARADFDGALERVLGPPRPLVDVGLGVGMGAGLGVGSSGLGVGVGVGAVPVGVPAGYSEGGWI